MKEYTYKDVSNMHKIMQYYRILTTTNMYVIFTSQNVSVFIQMNIPKCLYLNRYHHTEICYR